MATASRKIEVNPSAETIRVGPLAVHFLLTAKDSNGSLAMFELMVRSGVGVPAPAHSHAHYEETIYGLEGEMVWTVDGEEIVLGPGQAMTIPRGVVHRFDNRSDKDTKCLCVISPAEIGPEYFREVGAELASGAPDKARLMEIMLRHGLVPAPPA